MPQLGKRCWKPLEQAENQPCPRPVRDVILVACYTTPTRKEITCPAKSSPPPPSSRSSRRGRRRSTSTQCAASGKASHDSGLPPQQRARDHLRARRHHRVRPLLDVVTVTRFKKNSPTPPVPAKVFELETPAGRCELGAYDVFEAKTLAAEAAGCTYDDVQLVSITEQTPTSKES